MESKWFAASIFACALGFSLLLSASAQATTTYTYSGPTYSPFSIGDDPVPVGTYTTSMHVSGSFSVASPLININGDISALVTSYSFSDRRNTITNLTGAPPLLFFVISDASGILTGWNIEVRNIDLSSNAVFNAVGDQYMQIDAVGITGFPSSDDATFRECLSVSQGLCSSIGSDLADTRNALAGTWTMTTDATPLPAALPLFAAGLGTLSLLGWRRRRAQV